MQIHFIAKVLQIWIALRQLIQNFVSIHKTRCFCRTWQILQVMYLYVGTWHINGEIFAVIAKQCVHSISIFTILLYSKFFNQWLPLCIFYIIFRVLIFYVFIARPKFFIFRNFLEIFKYVQTLKMFTILLKFNWLWHTLHSLF